MSIGQYELYFVTPHIAPLLPNNKVLRQMRLEKIKKCYPPEAHEGIEHLDRAYLRDAECRVLINGSVISAALRKVFNTDKIVVEGAFIVPKESISINTVITNVGDQKKQSLLNYEFIEPGTVVRSILNVTGMELPDEIKIILGAKQKKGFGEAMLRKINENSERKRK